MKIGKLLHNIELAAYAALILASIQVEQISSGSGVFLGTPATPISILLATVWPYIAIVGLTSFRRAKKPIEKPLSPRDQNPCVPKGTLNSSVMQTR